MKFRKELEIDVRGLKAEKKTVTVIMDEVDDKEAKLKGYEKRLDATKKKIDSIDKQLEPLKLIIEEMQEFDLEYRNTKAEEGKLGKILREQKN